MAEGRMIKKVISTSRKLAELKTDSCRLLYTWILPHLDVAGRMIGDPYVVKGMVVPRIKSMTPDKVGEYLEELHEAGLITLYKDGGDTYLELIKFRDFQTLREDRESASIIPPANSGSTPGELPDESGVSKGKVSKVNIKEDNINDTKEPMYPSEFLKFWKAYPRKTAKGKAYDSWRKLKPNIGIVSRMLQTISIQKTTKDWKKDNGQFIPHPATWLNQRRWEDEGIEPEEDDDPTWVGDEETVRKAMGMPPC